VEGALCAGCGALQPPPRDPDFHAILGLPRRYHLEDTEIDAAWRDRSRRLHPDRHVAQSALQRRLSLQWTALLNEARRVLRDPQTRGLWLATGRATPADWGGPVLDESFLERIFRWRLALEAPDSGAGAEVRSAESALRAEIDEVFLAWEQERGDLERVPELLARMRALRKLTDLL
jgi:molecular chaperone HscB